MNCGLGATDSLLRFPVKHVLHDQMDSCDIHAPLEPPRVNCEQTEGGTFFFVRRTSFPLHSADALVPLRRPAAAGSLKDFTRQNLLHCAAFTHGCKY